MFTDVFDSSLATHLRAPEASLLLGMWQSARGIRRAPDESDFPERTIRYLRPSLLILHATGTGDWHFFYVGSQVMQQAGFDMTGKHVSDFTGELGQFFQSIYWRAASEIIPLVSIHRLGIYGENPLWERVILPIRRQNGEICLYVVNKVREIERDISHLTAHAKGRALVIIQFRRGEGNFIAGHMVAGANGLARTTLGRRADQISGVSLEFAMPDLAHPYLLDLFAEVARSGVSECLALALPCRDGLRRFDCNIAPFNDGVTIDFEPELAEKALGASA